MAACKLTVEFDEPNKVCIGGEPITGHVLVTSDKEVKCKALTVTSRWATHGQGNIAQGEVECKTLFQGSWQSGQEYRYPFSLATATWPPTYYGNYLNVSHFVAATADVPWSFDPKTSEEFQVTSTTTPEDLAPTDNKVKKTSWVVWLIGLVFGVILLVFVPFMLAILLPIAAVGMVGTAVYWVISKFLPSLITGTVEHTLASTSLEKGQTLRGSCSFTPQRSSSINGITLTVRCLEECVSGSGSNRETHRYEAFKRVQQLQDAGPLQAGQQYKFDFSMVIPESAPPSMKFTHNEIKWTSELRIDIPKWPDWKKETPLFVKVGPPSSTSPSNVVSGLSNSNMVDSDPWLTEVYQQVIQSSDDGDRLAAVVEAVGEQAFNITIDLQGAVDEPLDSNLDEGGLWLAAIDSNRNVRLVCRVAEGIDAQAMQWVDGWQGTALIIGFDSDSGRVMLRLA